MLNKLIISILFIFTLSFIKLEAKTNFPKVTLSVLNVNIIKDSLIVDFEFFNSSKVGVNMLKPDYDDIGQGIFKFYFFNLETNERYEILTRYTIDDLCSIEFSNKGSMYLSYNEGFRKIMIVNINKMIPLLIKGNYLFQIQYNLKGIRLISKLNPVFQGDLKSRKIKFEYLVDEKNLTPSPIKSNNKMK